MIGDKVFSFKKTILEAGLFESLKKEFGALDKFLEQNSKQIDQIAQDIGIALGFAVKKLADAIIVIKNNMDKFVTLIQFLIAVKVVTLFTNLAIAITNVAKAMMSFGFATLFTRGGLVGIAKAIAKGGLIFVAFKGMEKLFDDMKDSFDDFADGVKNVLPDARDLHKTLIPVKEIFDNLSIIAHDFEHELSVAIPNATDKAISKFRQLNSSAITNLENKFKNIRMTIAEGINSGITKMSQSLARAFVFGEKLSDTFKNMARSLLVNIISALIEIVARKGVELAIEKLITREKQKQAALSGGGSLFSAARSFLGFAKGGAVSKGQPVVVGERGAEMFIPNSTGQITQAARGTGGGQTTVNFNINTLDASGFDDLLVRNRGTITQIINNAVNERGSKNLI